MRPRYALRGESNKCSECKYYYQHYILLEKNGEEVYEKCFCGHCVQSLLKRIRTDQLHTCDAFEAK